MSSVNAVFTVAVDAVMALLGTLPPLVGLAVLALATAVLVLLVARWTIDRRAIETAKNRMQAAIFEMRLFNDDPRAVIRAALDVIRQNGTYLRLWLLPVVVLTVPLTPLMAQLDAYYAYAGLTPGASSLLTVDVADGGEASATGAPPVVLDVPAEVEVQTPAIWFPAARQVVWRILPRSTGEFDLHIRSGDVVLTKSLRVAGGIARRSPMRTRAGFVDELLYPSEAPLASEAPVDRITVAYPAEVVDLFLFGWQTSWMVPYLVLTLLFAFVLKGRFGVVF